MEKIDKKGAWSSISMPRGTFCTKSLFENDGKCFLDMISITGKVQNAKTKTFKELFVGDSTIEDKYWERLPSMEKFTVMIHEFANIFTTDYAHSGIYFQFDETSKIMDFEFRMEFNPNKIGPMQQNKIKQILLCSYDLSVSRLDVAFDFYEDLSELIIIDKTGKRTRTDYYANGGATRTGIAYGNRSSDLYLRLYNKYIEVERKLGKSDDDEYILADLAKVVDRNWYRIEFELKKKEKALKNIDSMEERILDKFEMYIEDFGNSNLTIEEKATLKYLNENPVAYSQLSKRHKDKYRKLQRSEDVMKRNLMIEIAERWESHKKEIQKQVNGLLRLGATYTAI